MTLERVPASRGRRHDHEGSGADRRRHAGGATEILPDSGRFSSSPSRWWEPAVCRRPTAASRRRSKRSARRLVERGHRVRVYTRSSAHQERTYLGMDVVHLPAVPQKHLETLSHTGFSAIHAVAGHRPDVAFVFNAANSPFLPLLRARGIPTALHMDGLEWRRSKWGSHGKAYYRWAERFGVRWADALIADAPGIADYYRHQFGVPTELIRYGAPLLETAPVAGVRGLGLESNGYHLVVARFEPRTTCSRSWRATAPARLGCRSWSSARRPTVPTTRRRSTGRLMETPASCCWVACTTRNCWTRCTSTPSPTCTGTRSEARTLAASRDGRRHGRRRLRRGVRS